MACVVFVQNYSMQHGAVVTVGHMAAAMVEKLQDSCETKYREDMIRLIREVVSKLGEWVREWMTPMKCAGGPELFKWRVL